MFTCVLVRALNLLLTWNIPSHLALILIHIWDNRVILECRWGRKETTLISYLKWWLVRFESGTGIWWYQSTWFNCDNSSTPLPLLQHFPIPLTELKCLSARKPHFKGKLKSTLRGNKSFFRETETHQFRISCKPKLRIWQHWTLSSLKE